MVKDSALPVKKQAQSINDAYAEYLGTFDWDFFCTFTTPYTLTLKSARRLMEKYHKDMAKGGSTLLFWVAEPFDVKEGFHTHALLKVPECYQFKHFVELWQVATGCKGKKKTDENGRESKVHARIELKKYQKNLGARHYVGKYMMKNGADYDFLT